MMEAKCLSKAQRLSSDIISTLPQAIIETILCLLPIQEAARTSILSREWRYRWTKIPKLVFHYFTMSKRTTKVMLTSDVVAFNFMDWRSKLFGIIHQVLLLRQGPIQEFELYVPNFVRYMSKGPPCFEVDQILLHLSRNHIVKKLTLWFDKRCSYKFPLCAFSLHHITDLDLCHIDLDHQPKFFSGFSSLRTLCLDDVNISTKPLLHLLSNCPSLTSFDLNTKQEPGPKDCTIAELFECLPMIEDLTTYGNSILPWLILDSVPKELPTSLIHLECFSFKQMWFVDDGLPFLAILIKCSPNLEKISLEIDVEHDGENRLSSDILEEYSDVWLEHLIELEIKCYRNLKPEMDFVKFILARSPKLEKVWISSEVETHQEEFGMLKTFLHAPHASFVVEIIVE